MQQHCVAEAVNPLFFRAVKRDYLEREAYNISLGTAGEEFIGQFEHWRLNSLGQSRLADKVDHVSKSKGDGLGYDILSFETNGKERFIEVKTTRFGKDTPFFVSKGEQPCPKQRTTNFIFIDCSSSEKRHGFLILSVGWISIAFWTQ